MPKFETVVDIFQRSSREFAARKLFGEKKDGQWRWMTYGEFAQRVDDLRGGLAQLGVVAGDRVAVISNNRSEWAIGAYAAYTLGASYVPMYEAQQEKEWEYILNDCGAKLVFCANKGLADRIKALQPNLPRLEHVIRFDPDEQDAECFGSLLRRGAETPTPMHGPKPEDLVPGSSTPRGPPGTPRA